MDRPKIDGIVDYIKAAYPDSWRDYVLCRAKLLNDIDDVCGDMDLIEGIDLALDVSDPHGAHLTMSHDNDIDRAWIPINYCPICGRNFRKDR